MKVCERCTENNNCAWQNHEETICHNAPAFPITNADRIRAMTDKELAMFLRQLTECVRCPAWDRDGEYDMRPCYTGKQSCSYMWLSWLKQEATDG